ncbi:MAG: arsenate reductase ArsC [Asticcacaulis sp.]
MIHLDRLINDTRRFKVLFLSEQNASRSVLAEALLNRLGGGRFEAWSAGINPAETLSPYAADLLRKMRYDVKTLSCKTLSAFTGEQAPRLDFVFRLSAHICAEPLPPFIGRPMVVDWPLADPDDTDGPPAEVAAAYASLFANLTNRIGIFVSLPTSSLESMAVRARLDLMGDRSLAMTG